MLVLSFLVLVSLLGRSSYGETSLALADSLKNDKHVHSLMNCESTQDILNSDKDRPIKVWKKYVLDCVQLKNVKSTETKTGFLMIFLIGVTLHKLQYRLQSLAPPFAI